MGLWGEAGWKPGPQVWNVPSKTSFFEKLLDSRGQSDIMLILMPSVDREQSLFCWDIRREEHNEESKRIVTGRVAYAWLRSSLITLARLMISELIWIIRIIVLPLQWIYQRPLTKSLTAYLFPSCKLTALPKAQWILFVHICMIDCNQLGSVTTTRIGKQSNMVFLKDQYWDLSYSTYSLMISLILSTMLN